MSRNSRLLGTTGEELKNEIKQMRSFAAVPGLFALFVVLWDAFETIVLPRRATDKFFLTRLFYRSTWLPWRALSHLFRGPKQRELFLSVYGPLSLIFLLIVWASGLIAGFALLHWADSSFLSKTYKSFTKDTAIVTCAVLVEVQKSCRCPKLRHVSALLSDLPSQSNTCGGRNRSARDGTSLHSRATLSGFPLS
jgi:hypothetical protein